MNTNATALNLATPVGGKSFTFRRAILGAALGVLLCAGLASQAQAAGPRLDPLAGDSWHAIKPSWPGTIVFDGKEKRVTLTPVGAEPMEATYTYTVTPRTDAAKAGVTQGTLKMVNKQGQVSQSDFEIVDGKFLTLSFAGGLQTKEIYQRMTPAEQMAEQARILKLMQEGKLKQVNPSISK